MTFTKHQAWTVVMGAAGAAYALLTLVLAARFGTVVCVIAVPIGATGYFFWRLYLRNVGASRAQAEQARRHVSELTHYIAEQDRIGKALEQSEAQFRSAFDHAPIGMALVSPTGRFIRVNSALGKIVGRREDELLGMNFQALTHPDDLAQTAVSLQHMLEKGDIETRQFETRYAHREGQTVWVLMSASVVRDINSSPAHYIFQVQNITDRKRAEERLVHDAFHDALTGLPNRALFMDRLSIAFKRRKRNSGSQFAVLFLDVDCFKVINDSLGHLIGDQMLIDVSGRLTSILRSNDSAARLGGDEFVMLIDDLGDVGEATKIAERLRQELSEPLHLGEQEVRPSVSIGIAMSSEQYQSPEEMLRDADTAMYEAKKCGRGNYQIFEPAMHERALRVLRLETDLRRAVECEEFSLFYQPIVDLQSHGIVGFEALVRWNHAARGLVSPAEFIPAAEETGLIVPLGLWVLKTACRQLVAWQRAGDCSADFWVSVNLSPRQFVQPDLIEQIIATLRETGLDPGSLKLEITESAVMENIDAALDLLKRLKSLRLSLSIDDFGTGHSSLSYLQRFPISALKIDRSFVSRMTESSESAEIVRTIIVLAQNLKMEVVAEGVETAEQLAQLQNLMCQSGQGYYFSRPVDAAAAGQLFHTLGPESELLVSVATVS